MTNKPTDKSDWYTANIPRVMAALPGTLREIAQLAGMKIYDVSTCLIALRMSELVIKDGHNFQEVTCQTST